MSFSMAGLASTAQGYQQGMRQISADDMQARKDQRDQYQFDQEKRVQAEKAHVDSIMKGDGAGLSTATEPKKSGSGFMDSIYGLFGAKPKEESFTTSAGLADATQGKSPALVGQQIPANEMPKPAEKIPYYRQAQARLDAYAEKNPHDTGAILAAQAQIDTLKKGDADKAHAEFLKRGESAIQRLIASGGSDVSGVRDVMSNHWPDGKSYDLRRTKDGGYDVMDGNGEVIKHHDSIDGLGTAFANLLHPDVYMAQHAKAQETGLIEGAKLPSQIALDNAKTNGEIKKADKTGVTAQRKAETAKLWAEAKKVSSEMTAGGRPHTTDAMANYNFIKQNNLAPKGTSDEDVWAMANTAKTNGNEQLIVTPDGGYLTYNHATGRITKTTEDGAVTEQRPAQRGAAGQVGANPPPVKPQVASGGAQKLW